MSDGPRFVVEVVPDVTGIDRTFDYFVPEEFSGLVEIGSRVRVDLNGRRIGGWVVATRHDEGAEELKPILKWSGIGPDADVIELCRWASMRWCVLRLRPFLVTASAPSMVVRPAPKQRTSSLASPKSPAATELLDGGGGVLRLPPTHDQLPSLLSASSLGPILVVCASVDSSRILAARLRRAGLSVAVVPQDWASARGGVDVVIGARSAAFAPCPDIACGVVLDEHEESLQEERMPTWHARDVLAQRCRRAEVPLLIVSASPTVVGSHLRKVVGPSPERERQAWPEVRVVDRSQEPPWNKSILSSEVIELARDRNIRMVCVANTKGLATLLACRNCMSLVRCEFCESTMSELEEGRLDCSLCGTSRPRICAVCSSTAISRLRPGVTRLREELEKAANRTVHQVDASQEMVDDSRGDLFIGPNVILNRLRHIDVVAFLDFDRELLAPRFSAHEQSMSLLIRAARLVGARRRGGRILLQTTLVDHDVIRAAVEGRSEISTDAELGRRRALGLPPYCALALIEGEGVDACAEALAGRIGITVSRHRNKLLVRADNHDMLSIAWSDLPHKVRSGVRIEVDPVSV